MITILTGPVGGGKTTFLKAVVGRLAALGRPPDGYLSERAGTAVRRPAMISWTCAPAGGFLFFESRGPRTASGRAPLMFFPAAWPQPRISSAEAIPPVCLSSMSSAAWSLAGGAFGRRPPRSSPTPGGPCLVVVRDTLMEDFQSAGRRGLRLRPFRCLPRVIRKFSSAPSRRGIAYERTRPDDHDRAGQVFRRVPADVRRQGKDFRARGGDDLGCLLERLGDSSARRAELFAAPEAGKPPALHPHIVVMVNGENASARGGWNGELRAGDTVAVFPLMGGG